jgi:hypothetical protein
MSIAQRLRYWTRAAALVTLLLSVTTVASAAKDAAAARAADRAMNELFAAASFDEAKAALEKTLGECKGCSNATLARLHMDLAVVLVTGFRDTKRGTEEMSKARGLDPTITLDPMTTTPEVQAAFNAAPASPAGQDVVLEDEDDAAAKKKKKKHHVEEEDEEPQCRADADCDAPQLCRRGKCVAPPPPPRDPGVWLSFGLVQDFGVSSGSDVCTKASQVSGGFTCLRNSGSQYHGTPLAGHAGKAGGFAVATTRVTLASNFRLWESVSGGIRMGYAFAGQGPQPDGGKKFLGLQAELQAAYWLSGKALSSKNTGTFLEASFGMAEIDAKSRVTIQENTAVPPPSSQLDNPSAQALDAYKKGGAGFAGVGAGLFLPFARASALLADLRFSALFPSSGLAISLGVSGAFGL